MTWRRTGFPVVPLVPQAVIPTLRSGFERRTPSERQQCSGRRVGHSDGEDGMTVKLWWAGGANK